jgi:hypothetical protein
MTGATPAVPAGPAAPAGLPARLFRALYAGYDLHAIDGIYVAVPAGTPCFAGPSLGQIARQISTRPACGPASTDPAPPAPGAAP